MSAPQQDFKECYHVREVFDSPLCRQHLPIVESFTGSRQGLERLHRHAGKKWTNLARGLAGSFIQMPKSLLPIQGFCAVAQASYQDQLYYSGSNYPLIMTIERWDTPFSKRVADTAVSSPLAPFNNKFKAWPISDYAIQQTRMEQAVCLLVKAARLTPFSCSGSLLAKDHVLQLVR